jgi:hypothetical protein
MELNKWLVREGWAVNFEPYAKGRFLREQADAANNRRGIWKGCFAVPTDWRHWKKDAPLIGSACPSDAASRIFDCRAATDRALRVHLDQTVGSATPGSAPGLTPPLHLAPKLGVLERGEMVARMGSCVFHGHRLLQSSDVPSGFRQTGGVSLDSGKGAFSSFTLHCATVT